MAKKERELKIVIGAKDKYSSSLTAAQRKFKAFGASIGSFIKKGAVVAAAALAGLVLAMRKSILMAGSFGKGMAEISTLSSEVARNIDAYADALIELSGRTGQPLAVLQKSLYDTVSAGIAAGEAIQFLDTATKLAVGGVAETSQAVDVLTSILNAYNLEAGEAEIISDELFTTVKLGKTTISDLSSSVGQVAPLMKASGASTKEMFAAVAELTLALPSTSESITGLRGVMVALSKPTEKLTAALGGASIETVGLGGVLKILGEKTGGSLEKMLEFIPRVEGANAALILAQGGAAGFAEKLIAMQTATGASNEAFKKMSDTWDFRVNRMSANAKTLFTSIGEVITKNRIFNDVVDTATSLFSKWTQRIRDNRLELMDLAKTGLAIVVEGVASVIEVMRLFHNTWLGLKLIANETISFIADRLAWLGEKARPLLKIIGEEGIADALDNFKESSRDVADSVVADVVATNQQYDAMSATIFRVAENMRALKVEEMERAETGGNGGDGGNGGAETQRLATINATRLDAARENAVALGEIQRSQLEEKFIALDESLLFENERQTLHFEQQQFIIDAAYQTSIISKDQRDQNMEQLELRHQAKLGKVEAKGILARQKFEQMSRGLQMQQAFGDIQMMTAASAQSNREMFEINKTAAIARAVVSGYQGAIYTWNAYPYPWNIPMTALHVAGTLMNLQKLQSASYSGGGTATAPSGGGMPSVADNQARQSLVDQQIADRQGTFLIGLDGEPTQPAQQITINVINPLNGEVSEAVQDAIVEAINNAGDRDVRIRVEGATA